MWEFDGNSSPEHNKGRHIHKLQQEGSQSQKAVAGGQDCSDEQCNTQLEDTLTTGEQKGGGVGEGGDRKKECIVW